MDQVDRIAYLTLSLIGGVMFLVAMIRIHRRGSIGQVTRHADGSAVTPEEKRAHMRGLRQALVDPAHRGDLVLLVAGLIVASGLMGPVWRAIRAIVG